MPVDNLIGEENRGFIGIMLNFNQERLGMAAGACGYAKVCLDEAIAYARERHTFGKPLIANQVVRHRLVDMAMRINAVKSTLELLACNGCAIKTEGAKALATALETNEGLTKVD